MRCLAKDPVKRYRHIGDVRMDLHDARLAKEWEAPPATASNAGRFAIPVAIAASLLLIGFVVWHFTRPAASPPAAAAPAVAQRFDLAFPNDFVQADLERVQIAITRDGKKIVVACKTQDGQALWMRTHHDGEWHRLEQTENGHRPFFSNDGEWITFFRAAQLYKRKTSGGGDPIKLASITNWYGATWADDTSVVYAAAWGDSLQIITPGASGPRPCTMLDTSRNERSHIGPATIPGTSWMLYNVWCGGETTDIYATDLKTNQKHLVITNASTPRVAATPRGDYLLFERASIIFAIALNKKDATVSGTETTVAEGVMNDGTRFAAYYDVASDGTLVYFPGTSFAEESRLGFVNPDGTSTPINDDRMSFCEPAFFANGTKMAVLVKGKLYRCLIYDLQRKTKEFLVTGGDTVSYCASPDGQTIACTVNRDGGYGIDLFSLVDGHRIGRIMNPTEDYASDMSWSADGKLIMFSMAAHAGSPSDIWLVEPKAGAVARTLVATPGGDIKPAFSPDGKWVAYSSDTTGRNEIYLTTLPDGRATRQVTFEGGSKPVWSNDGKTLFFTSSRGLCSVNLTTDGTVTGLPAVVYSKPFGQSDPIAREYVVAPDGRPLVVEPSERRPTVSHLRVITNWSALLP
jgi:Tol biopolymer transport system component